MSSDIFSSEIFEQPPVRARDVDPFRMTDSVRSYNPVRKAAPRRRAVQADAPAQDFEDIPLTPPTAEENRVYMDKDGVIHRCGA